MSLHRFFLENQTIADDCVGGEPFAIRLSTDDLAHAGVLRLEIGEHIACIDSASDYFECEIASFDADGNPEVRICGHLDAPAESVHLTLVQSLAKSDKFEQVLKHATEVGVERFIPLVSKRCVVKLDEKRADSKKKRWRAIAKNAAMQSGRFAIPEVDPICNVMSLCKILAQFDAVLLCWEEADISLSVRQALCDVLALDSAQVAIVVGPEGGFSEDEVDMMLASAPCVKLVSLGSYILRTETAPVVASAIVVNEFREAQFVSRDCGAFDPVSKCHTLR